MTTTLFPGHLSTSVDTPSLTGTALRCVPAGHNLWRVQDRPGHVLGHLRATEGPLGVTYQAQRWNATTRAFRTIGEFWAASDAVTALRYG